MSSFFLASLAPNRSHSASVAGKSLTVLAVAAAFAAISVPAFAQARAKALESLRVPGDGRVVSFKTSLDAGELFLLKAVGSVKAGADTSGRNWDRTRKMGVNCLAFRAAQDGAFYATDPDIAAVTHDVPWEMTRQWLDLVARSGAVLFVALQPDAAGAVPVRGLICMFPLPPVQRFAAPCLIIAGEVFFLKRREFL